MTGASFASTFRLSSSTRSLSFATSKIGSGTFEFFFFFVFLFFPFFFVDLTSAGGSSSGPAPPSCASTARLPFPSCFNEAFIGVGVATSAGILPGAWAAS
jgi:hypothetical protein